MEFPQKVKDKPTMWSSNSTSEHIPKRNENGKDIYTAIFTAASQ